jgi:hypothetical protein
MRIVHRHRTESSPGARDLDRHLPFQHREWRAQQIGWIALGLFLAAALAGLFGSGPLSSAVAADPGGRLRVDYQRFVRAGASQRLLFRIYPGGTGPVTLKLSRGYLDRMRVEHITPPPSSSFSAAEWTTFVFAPGTDVVAVDGEPLEAGRHVLTAATGAGGSLSLWQLAYF